MKIQFIIISFCLILTAAISSAQTEKPLKNINSKIEAVYKKEATVYKPLATLYAHEPNVVRIIVEGYSKILVKTDNGNVTDKGKGYYIIIPDTTGKLMLKVYDNSSKDQPLLVLNKYKVVAAPQIVSIYAGVKTGNITRMKFLSDSIIQFNDEEFPFAYQYKMVYFKMTVTEAGRVQFRDIQSDGNRVPKKVRDFIDAASVGTKISFDYIKAKLIAKPFDEFEIGNPTDNSIHLMEPMTLTISD